MFALNGILKFLSPIIPKVSGMPNSASPLPYPSILMKISSGHGDSIVICNESVKNSKSFGVNSIFPMKELPFNKMI